MASTEQQPLPTVPEDISASWLGSVLGQPVKSIDITSSQLNATASKIFITVTYDGDSQDASASRPSHICIKGGFNPAMLAMEGYSEILRVMYSREVKFYNLVAPKVKNMTLPKTWWSGEDAQGRQAIVIMEDLSKEHTFGDPTQAWPVDRVKAGLEQLAALHAETWGSTVSGDNAWLTPVYENVMLGLAQNWQAMVLDSDRPPIPEGIRNQERTVAAMTKHFAHKNPKFLAILHGDPHTGNTYLDKAGRPYFLDWQTLHIGSAFHDVAYFVVGALSVEDRRAHEMELVEHYLKAVAAAGGPTLSTDSEDVVKEYKEAAIAGMGWLLTPYQMQPRERVWAMCERYCAAMVDHDTIGIIEARPNAA